MWGYPTRSRAGHRKTRNDRGKESFYKGDFQSLEGRAKQPEADGRDEEAHSELLEHKMLPSGDKLESPADCEADKAAALENAGLRPDPIKKRASASTEATGPDEPGILTKRVRLWQYRPPLAASIIALVISVIRPAVELVKQFSSPSDPMSAVILVFLWDWFFGCLVAYAIVGMVFWAIKGKTPEEAPVARSRRRWRFSLAAAFIGAGVGACALTGLALTGFGYRSENRQEAEFRNTAAPIIEELERVLADERETTKELGSKFEEVSRSTDVAQLARLQAELTGHYAPYFDRCSNRVKEIRARMGRLDPPPSMSAFREAFLLSCERGAEALSLASQGLTMLADPATLDEQALQRCQTDSQRLFEETDKYYREARSEWEE